MSHDQLGESVDIPFPHILVTHISLVSTVIASHTRTARSTDLPCFPYHYAPCHDTTSTTPTRQHIPSPRALFLIPSFVSCYGLLVVLFVFFWFFGMVFFRPHAYPAIASLFSMVFDSLVVYFIRSASSTCDLRSLNTYIIMLRSGDTLMMLDSLTT
jgi:hypothetical protein